MRRRLDITNTESIDFPLHTRLSKKGPVFYVQFRKDDGRWSTAKSTHILVGAGKRANDDALKRATAWAQSYLDHGQVVTRERATFEAFAEGFFDPDGEWAREKRRRGHRLSADQCERHSRSTKNHLVPFWIHDELVQLLAQNPLKTENRFVFYSIKPDKPMDQREFTEALYSALEKIGITEAERKERGLDFHAWRHTFNSLLIDRRIPLQAMQSVTGHLTPEMTQRYYHLGGEAGAGIREVAESLFVERTQEKKVRPQKQRQKARRRTGRQSINEL